MYLKSIKEYSREHGLHLSDIEPKLVSGAWKLKLGDFGHCCRVDGWSSYEEEGDTRYCAAELIGGASPDLKAADIFSLGASVYELCTGVPLPDSGDGGTMWRDVRSGRLPLLGGEDRGDAAAGLMEPDGDDGEVSRTQFSKNLISCIRKVVLLSLHLLLCCLNIVFLASASFR